YHYAPYEPAALKRMMGRYATREEEVDRMLRGHLFVDLFSVARHGLRASVESYSIKELEAFYDFKREADLRDAGIARARVEACLELGDADALADKDRETVGRYNADDCRSTVHLRDWLETLRQRLIASGESVPRPVPPEDKEPPEKTAAWLQQIMP